MIKRYEFHGIRLVLEQTSSILPLRNAVRRVQVSFNLKFTFLIVQGSLFLDTN